MIFGHDRARAELEEQLPPVALLKGPKSVGRHTIADHLKHHHGYKPYDVRVIKKLTVDESRELKTFAATTAMGRAGKLVVADLDGASAAALNALLKLLEEPPAGIKFILIATRRVLDTISSRANVYQLGLLSEQDVYNILTQRFHHEPRAARRAAEVSGGQVERAMTAGDQDQSRAVVLTVLKAIAERDSELLEAAAPSWDRISSDLMVRWATESLSGRWQVFEAAESFGLHKDRKVLLRILRGMNLDVRPRLQLRAVLEPLTRR